MADENRPRVTDLLPDRVPIAAIVEKAMCEDPKVRGAAFAWDLVGERAWKEMLDALDCDLLDLLAQGWQKSKALQKYADPAECPNEMTVYLSEHEFVEDVHPVLEVSIPYCPPKRLRFTLSLAAHFGALALWVKRGHITGCGAGEAWVSARLKYRELDLCPEQASRKLPLSGRFSFREPGLRISSPFG